MRVGSGLTKVFNPREHRTLKAFAGTVRRTGFLKKRKETVKYEDHH